MTREEKAIEGILIISSALSEEGRKKLTANLVGQLSEQDRKELLEKLAGEKSADTKTPITTPREMFPDTPDRREYEYRQYTPQQDKQQEDRSQPEDTSANIPQSPPLNPEESGRPNLFAAGFRPTNLTREASDPITMQTSNGPNKNTAEQNAVNQLMQSQNYNNFIKRFTHIITKKVMQGEATDKASKTSKILKLFVDTIRESINKDPSQKDSNLVNAIKNIKRSDLTKIMEKNSININMDDRRHTEGIGSLMKLINEDLKTQNPSSIAQEPERNDAWKGREL